MKVKSYLLILYQNLDIRRIRKYCTSYIRFLQELQKEEETARVQTNAGIIIKLRDSSRGVKLSPKEEETYTSTKHMKD